MKAKGVAIWVQKGLPIDVQRVITDINGQCLILCAKIAGTVLTMINVC